MVRITGGQFVESADKQIEPGWYYVRISNHWGSFSTTEESNGEVYYKGHRWELAGGRRRKDGEYAETSQAGCIKIADLD